MDKKEELTPFAKIKWDVAQIQFNYLGMNEAKTAIEANPSIHRIAEYIEQNYIRKDSQPLPSVQGLIDALTEITNCLGVINFSSHSQMKEGINGAMELAENALSNFKSQEPGIDGWVKDKPDLKRECFVITADYYRDNWYYKMFEMLFQDGYWKILDDGEEWGDHKDLNAQYYRIIPINPPSIPKP